MYASRSNSQSIDVVLNGNGRLHLLDKRSIGLHRNTSLGAKPRSLKR